MIANNHFDTTYTVEHDEEEFVEARHLVDMTTHPPMCGECRRCGGRGETACGIKVFDPQVIVDKRESYARIDYRKRTYTKRKYL